MQMIENMRMSGDWQVGKGAIADLCYCPTELKIVNLEMSKIDFSELEGNENLITMADFSGGDGLQIHRMYEYVKAKGLNPAAYYNEMHTTRFNTAMERYSHLDNFNMVNTDFFFLKCRHKNGNAYKKENIAIIRNNPPYTFIEQHGQTVRAEEAFFLENSLLNASEGVHIFELPIHQLTGIENLLKKILYRYEAVHIFKFPKKDFLRYKQVVVIGVRKKTNSADLEKAEILRNRLINDQIPYLDDDDKPVVKLSSRAVNSCKPINVYRDGRVNDVTLSNGYNQVISSVWDKVSKSTNKHLMTIKERGKPIIEKLIGNQAMELNAGAFNGIQGNSVLIKGGYEKEIVVTEEMEGTTKVTTRTEVIKPTIAVTNKVGDILVKGQL